jgi:predicted O-methyltransferase YrrM
MPDIAFARVLDTYRQRMADESARQAAMTAAERGARVDEFLLSVGEDAAELLRDMIVGLSATLIVELGTSYGFSTLYLADAARRTGGRVHSYDLAANKQAWARERLAEAGLDGFVTFHTGDAVKLLADQPGPVDFVLMDLWKDLYIPCLDQVYPKLAPNGVIVADNMLHPEQARANATLYRAAVRAKPDMQAVLLPLGHGIDIACKVVLPA